MGHPFLLLYYALTLLLVFCHFEVHYFNKEVSNVAYFFYRFYGVFWPFPPVGKTLVIFDSRGGGSIKK